MASWTLTTVAAGDESQGGSQSNPRRVAHTPTQQSNLCSNLTKPSLVILHSGHFGEFERDQLPQEAGGEGASALTYRCEHNANHQRELRSRPEIKIKTFRSALLGAHTHTLSLSIFLSLSPSLSLSVEERSIANSTGIDSIAPRHADTTATKLRLQRHPTPCLAFQLDPPPQNQFSNFDASLTWSGSAEYDVTTQLHLTAGIQSCMQWYVTLLT
jgi:hypothetical protein